MRTPNHSKDSPSLKNQDRILKVFAKILQKKEDQLQSLAMSWKILEHRIKTQHENHKEQLSLMKNEIKTLEISRLVRNAKCNLVIGLKERDRSLCKSKFEHAEDELVDFKAWFDLLTQNSTNKDVCDSRDLDECKSLEVKIKKLKLEFENLAFVKRCDVSKLLKETGFAWSQFKEMESGFTDKLMKKDEEIKKLQLSNSEKDEIITRLMGEMEENGSKKRLRRSPRLNTNV